MTLKDGQKIGGRYDSESFSSSSPSDPQLYLEENWVLSVEGGFERPRLDTAGILILSSEIVAVEFFKFESEKNNVREETESTVSGGVSAGKKREHRMREILFRAALRFTDNFKRQQKGL